MTLRNLRGGALALALAAGIALPALAQRQPLYQDGAATSGRVAKFTAPGRVTDPGGLDGGSDGKGVSPFAVTDNNATGLAINSAATTGQYNRLALGHDSSGNGVIDLDSYNGMGAKKLKFRFAGSDYWTLDPSQPAPSNTTQVYVNLLDRGVKCDGADDGPAINAAIASVASFTRLELPAGGNCYTAETIVIPPGKDGITLAGGGGESTVLYTNLSIPLIQVGTYTYAGADDFRFPTHAVRGVNISGLRLDNTSATKTGTAGVDLRGSNRGVVRGIRCMNLANCIVVRPISGWNVVDDINLAGTGAENVVLVNGDGYNAGYNSTGNMYSNIRGQSVKTSLIQFTGCTFGDIVASNVIGTGIMSGGNGTAGGAVAGVWLNSSGANCTDAATRYATKISLSNIDMDGRADYVVRGTNANLIDIGPTAKGGNVTNDVSFDSPSTNLSSGIWRVSADLKLASLGGAPLAQMHLQGNVSASAWTINGIGLRAGVATYTDTTSSGTVPEVTIHSLAAPTIAASSPTTYSYASTVRIGGPPIAGPNVTLTKSVALDVAAGEARFVSGATAGLSTARIATGRALNTGESGVQILYGTVVADTGSIQALTQGTIQRNLVINPSGGNVGIGTDLSAPRWTLDVNGTFGLALQTPATSAATCTTGQLTFDLNYIYACVSTNTWKRAAMTSW